MPPAPERLFLFVQCELPGVLGPPDGRYLLRSELDGEPERVIVLKTLSARRAAEGARGVGSLGLFAGRRAGATRRREAAPEPEPTAVPVTRATIVDPVSVSAERQAQAWIEGLEPAREVATAFAALNRLLYCYRLAAADPYAHEVTPIQALTLRAGWGEGEQVADGVWLHAQELPITAAAAVTATADSTSASQSPPGRSRRRAPRARVRALRPDEHLAELLAARERPLLCEELALRARADLELGRPSHAALELDRALTAAAHELSGEQSLDLGERVAELESLRPEIARTAAAVLRGEAPTDAGQTPTMIAALDREALRHALERLEAALRARAAAGYETQSPSQIAARNLARNRSSR